MKSYFLLLAVLLLPLLSFGQANSLSVYTEGREKFTLILDGQQQNVVPKGEIRIEQLKKSHYNAQIVFADKSLKPISSDLRVVDPDGKPADITYKVITDGNGSYIFKLLSCVPATGGYTSNEQDDQDVTGTYYDPTAPIAVSHNTTSSQSTSTESIAGAPGQAQPMRNMGNVEQNGINTMNNTIANKNVSQNNNMQTTSVKYGLGDGRTRENTGGCDHAMDDAAYKGATNAVLGRDDETSKLIVAKNVIDNNCMTAQQVSDMCKLFSYDNTKLEFAEYAYVRTVDAANYGIVNGCFELESNKQKLAIYIKNHQ